MTTPIPTLDNLATQLGETDQYKGLGSALGDRRDGRVYVHDDRIRTATRVALATGRPLLLRGPAGTGKSSLAPFMARALKRRFYAFTVTARTQARDLMWRFDALGRLSDAQIRRPGDDGPSKVDRLEHYVEPGVLWWALDPASARRRGVADGEIIVPPVSAPDDPGKGPIGNGAVVLIDEIDKADPDVPNNLLEPLGSLQFSVDETQANVALKGTPPLVFITTNDERELPAAFRRRCVILYLQKHERADLIAIARVHFGDHNPPVTDDIAGRIADAHLRLRDLADKDGQRPPSTAEYLDAVRACLRLGADPGTGGEWTHIEQLALSKKDPFAKA
jgi:MoxR-like ATPase